MIHGTIHIKLFHIFCVRPTAVIYIQLVISLLSLSAHDQPLCTFRLPGYHFFLQGSWSILITDIGESQAARGPHCVKPCSMRKHTQKKRYDDAEIQFLRQLRKRASKLNSHLTENALGLHYKDQTVKICLGNYP